MTNKEHLAEEIYARFGTVQRARGCFLYTKKGIRLTDMYQEGGRAILGWGQGSSSTVLKNTLNRHVTGFFKTEFDNRTKKAIETLLSSPRDIFFYYDYTSALKSALGISKNKTCIYRAWNFAEIDISSQDAVIIAPPYPWENLFILAANPVAVKDALSCGTFFDKGVKIPAPLNSAISRSIYDLINAIKTRSEKDWFIYDKILTLYWTRKGPYLFPKMSENDYPKFIQHCLDCNIVISPDYNTPSIIPFGADKGVFTKLKNAPFEFSPDLPQPTSTEGSN